MTAWTEGGPEPPPRRPSLRLLAGVAGAVAVLAAVGATGGWLVARTTTSNQASAGRDPTPPASHPSSPSPTGPTPGRTDSTPSPTGSIAPIAAGFPLPDLTGRDFLDARRQLRQLRLGVRVDFDGDGDDRSVERTTPRAGTRVHAGITVKLHVRGDAPTLRVPLLLGKACAAAGREAADRGLDPRYDPEKAGVVVRQDPLPYAEAEWNDRIKLACRVDVTPGG